MVKKRLGAKDLLKYIVGSMLGQGVLKKWGSSKLVEIATKANILSLRAAKAFEKELLRMFVKLNAAEKFLFYEYLRYLCTRGLIISQEILDDFRKALEKLQEEEQQRVVKKIG